MSETIKKYAVTAVIAILAVMIYNNWIQPRLGGVAPTA